MEVKKLPDKPLTKEQQQRLMLELASEGKLAKFSALDEVQFAVNASLYDICFLELIAKIVALHQILNEQDEKISELQRKLEELRQAFR
jgi:Tfp pilus assembly ATPase PilU